MKQERSGFKKFLLLWGGELISSVGGGLTSFGLSVYVFQRTGSAADMALVSLLAFLPTLLLSAPAGVLADRYDRRLLMMLGDGLSGLGILYIFICMLRGEASLVQICVGVSVSSVFSALLEPAYRATVSDLLTKEEYSRANGLVSLAGSARYLLSPMIAGLLLAVSDIRLLLLIDICTFFVTVSTTAIVKRGCVTKRDAEQGSFMSSFREGWQAITEKRGIPVLLVVSSLMTCFMGTFQILAEPMILSFADSTFLGIVETISACGMLASSLLLGVRGIRSGHVRILCGSLAFAGAMIAVFGLKEHVALMLVSGFLFFAMLPFSNNCLDYLVRINIADEKQGRAWGLIGMISQIGYVVAYSLAGLLADRIADWLDISVGRGAACVVVIAGVLLILTAGVLALQRPVRELENA